MEEITDRFGMRPHLRLGTEVTDARFDEAFRGPLDGDHRLAARPGRSTCW